MTCTDMRVVEFVFEEELSECVCSAWYAGRRHLAEGIW